MLEFRHFFPFQKKMLWHLENKNINALFKNLIYDKNKQIKGPVLKPLSKAGMYNTSMLKSLHR